ncbi:MAG: rhodanese-like domain-containing protein [Fimbriimonadaceae bacterium]|nr:rhodanese-like domain-containing protein [Fimbriimonadaceae bacterium]
MLPEIDPPTLSALLKGPNPPRVLDVREPEELAISSLTGAVLIPLQELPTRFAELDPDADWVVICRSGSRSRGATQFLLERGFRSVLNLSSGMNGWSRTVDPSVKTY